MPSKCCACGQTESDFRAVRKAEQVASQPKCEAVDCAPCAAPPKAFAAACDAGACKVVSIGDSPLDACGADTDCTLHAQGCCECGSPGQIALAKSQVAAYEGSVCLPNATCPGCLPLFPPAAARCAGGHCKVEPLACPPSAPAPGSPCSLPSGVDECEFGADPVLACRSKGKCVGGAWQVTDYDCAPLPGPGVAGCLTSASQAGQTCSNEGTFCQVGAAICACDACSFGPCSMTAHWVCSTAQAGCPSTPPPKGGACQGVQACEYGPCGSKTGARRVCKDGVWKDEPQACPV
ncbi:MAG: hypothetical protein IT374_28005 [Polyangiaceae bacterium]|nr:hypothetical protein [Polyangiaceae bacterium]